MLAALLSFVLTGPDIQEPEIGDQVANFEFTDIRFLRRSLEDFGEPQAFVLVFTTVDCPLVARYMPRLKELCSDFRRPQVQWLAVNVGKEDSIQEMAGQAIQNEMPFPFVKDFEGEVVRSIGVKRTPEVAVLDADRILRYRGRIDEQYRLGGARPDPGRSYLREALQAVLKGLPVSVSETPVDGCVITLPSGKSTRESLLTYTKDVAPIIHAHCLECHRRGGGAPISFESPRKVVALAEMVAEVVRQERMPPWYAHPEFGEFENDRRLSNAEKQLVVDWALQSGPMGDLSDLADPPEFSNTAWRIPEPDLVIEQTKAIEIPADGYIPYEYVFLPHVFEEDTWLQAIEISSDNPRVVHHANLVYYKWGERVSSVNNFITGYVPGGDPMNLPAGVAFPLPAGSTFVLQVHLVTTGRPELVRLKVGLRFPKDTIRKRLRHFQVNNSRFQIPPEAAAHPVSGIRRFRQDSTGLGMFVHMHLRGRDMTMTSIGPDGEREILLMVPNYNFDWQQAYRWYPNKMKFTRNTRIEALAHFDNSSFNPYNPDPDEIVEFGLQTFHEMMIGFLFYTYDAENLELRVDPTDGTAEEDRK